MVEVVVGICIVLMILLLILLSTYNGLMQQRHDVRTAWSAMDEFLKRRYDLVPMLISAVRATGGEAVAKLPAITEAKNQAAVAFSPSELARAESALTTAIQEVLAEVSRDPTAVKNPSVIEIQRLILNSENQISQSRTRYNDQVEALNSAMTSFPQGLTARVIGLHAQPTFED